MNDSQLDVFTILCKKKRRLLLEVLNTDQYKFSDIMKKLSYKNNNSLNRDLIELLNFNLITKNNNLYCLTEDGNNIVKIILDIKHGKTDSELETEIKKLKEELTTKNNELSKSYRLNHNTYSYKKTIFMFTQIIEMYEQFFPLDEFEKNSLSILENQIGYEITNIIDINPESFSLIDEYGSQYYQINGKIRFISLKVGELVTKDISKFPNEILNFDYLMQLQLNGFDFSKEDAIPDEFQNLTSLRELDLSGNNMNAIPDVICNLSNLKSLKLSSTFFDTDEPTKNNIYEIPDAFRKLTNIEEVNLADNRLNISPESIKNLYNVKHLDLANNMLTFLPDSIGELINLESLYLYDNNIKTLPKSMEKLSKLKLLYLERTKLQYIPSFLLNLPLKHLSVSKKFKEDETLVLLEKNGVKIDYSDDFDYDYFDND